VIRGPLGLITQAELSFRTHVRDAFALRALVQRRGLERRVPSAESVRESHGELAMSRRIALSVVAGVAVLAGAGAFALAYAGDQAPALAHSTARYTAPDGGRDGSFTFSTEVRASSGVRSLKVLAWPEKSELAAKQPTAKDMAEVESAHCKPAGADTVRCVYTAAVTAAEAASSPRGSWHVAVLATAEDGTTTLDTKAVDLTGG